MVPEEDVKVRLVSIKTGGGTARMLEEVLESGYLVQGEKVRQLEESLARFLRVGEAVAVSSGTAALHLALMSLGLGKGDTVLVPAYTFPSTANVVERLGASVRFVDVGLDTFNIEVPDLISKYDSSCRCVIPVHLFGVPADMDPILEFAQEQELYVLEDAACALGASYRGRLCGTMGDAGCFSFHPRKILTTGEGGLIISGRSELIDQVRSARDHGFVRAGEMADIETPGLNYRMSELHASVGIAGLDKLEEELGAREHLASVYDTRFEGVSGLVKQKVPEGALRVYQSYTVLLPPGSSRGQVISGLSQMGVESTVGTYAVHLLSYYRDKYNISPDLYPHAALLSERSLTLPLHSSMSNDDVCYVTDCLEKVLSI